MAGVQSQKYLFFLFLFIFYGQCTEKRA
jgi:hypothetical protein